MLTSPQQGYGTNPDYARNSNSAYPRHTKVFNQDITPDVTRPDEQFGDPYPLFDGLVKAAIVRKQL
jgi:hypothetical protein